MNAPESNQRNLLRWVVLSALLMLASNPAWWIKEFHHTPETAGEAGKVSQYLEQYLDEALEISEFSGIPASIILAMGGLESGWGTSELARQANNHFGIKANPAAEPVYWVLTQEQQADRQGLSPARESFRKYPDVLSCYKDLARHLQQKQRYAWLFRIPAHRFDRWAIGLETSGYATDPDYGEKLIGIIKRYNLYRY